MSHHFFAGSYSNTQLSSPVITCDKIPLVSSASRLSSPIRTYLDFYSAVNTRGMKCGDTFDMFKSFSNTVWTLLWLTPVTVTTSLSVLQRSALISISILAIIDGVCAILGRPSLSSSNAPPLTLPRIIRSTHTALIGSMFSLNTDDTNVLISVFVLPAFTKNLITIRCSILSVTNIIEEIVTWHASHFTFTSRTHVI